MLFWRDLKLPVTPSAHLFEDRISNKISTTEAGITNKTEDHIKLSCQIGKRLERKYKSVADFT